MIYFDCVIKEVLRFSSPVDSSIRTLTSDDRLPECGFQLYKHESIYISFYNLAYDTRYWKFYPERFLSNDKDHPPLANIPFGSGHRQCIGKDLALFELKLICARLIQFITFGDGRDQINSGDYLLGLIIMLKHVGVTINFD